MTDALTSEALPAPLTLSTVLRWPGTDTQADQLAAEVPVALVFNGVSHAVMMATPQDLEALALGFALSEGILDGPEQCHGMEVLASNSGTQPAIEVHLDIAAGCFARLKDLRRNLAGRTGCGVCGVESLQALGLDATPMARQDWVTQLTPATVFQAIDYMHREQALNAECGSLHAAAWVRKDGSVACVMEDVGRHNALDKVLGTLALQRKLSRAGWVLMSSRASHELVRKCIRLQVPMLATISAPTDLAVTMAQQAGLRLWGLCRRPQAVLYTP